MFKQIYTSSNGMASVKSAIKGAAPEFLVRRYIHVRNSLRLKGEFRRDARRYARYALPGEVCGLMTDARNLEAQLTKDYHRIEKGLALPVPKKPFGLAVMARIHDNITAGESAGTSHAILNFAQTAHGALAEWNSSGAISETIAPQTKPRGARNIDDPAAFFKSRHSVRDFGLAHVHDSVLEDAVDLAMSSPSVCNRQAWFVRFYRNSNVKRVLQYQNGNSGFTEVVPVVGLITVDTRLFASPGERNQPWIEGGIFSMSLVWALHALGLESCMLNMSVSNSRASALREDLGLADYELVIMMIAIGYGSDGHRVARSPRRPLKDVIISID